MKNIYQKIILSLMLCILSFTMVLQFTYVEEDYSFVSLKNIEDLKTAINKEEEEIKDLIALIEANKGKLREYGSALITEGSIQEVLRSEIDNMKAFSGFKDLEGPGITVKLQDSDRDLYEGEDPGNLVIHDGDILIILNALKIAGAEVLSVNGQRILSTSEIKCTGPTITINNHTYGQPFIIRAIGDPETLDAAIKAPGSYAEYLKNVYGLKIESYVSDSIKIPKYDGNIHFKNITPVEGD
ncbi:MAG: DUF881 domain-containing protein [Clostridiales bacterium]|nr:DUF881 domain-containing protein [Clostridiales bacterium]